MNLEFKIDNITYSVKDGELRTQSGRDAARSWDVFEHPELLKLVTAYHMLLRQVP